MIQRQDNVVSANGQTREKEFDRYKIRPCETRKKIGAEFVNEDTELVYSDSLEKSSSVSSKVRKEYV